MEYKVLKTTDEEILENEVNRHLTQGWNLQGGISVSKRIDNTFNIYCQALVR